MRGMGYVMKRGLAIVLSVAMLSGGLELPARAVEDGADLIVPEVVMEAQGTDYSAAEVYDEARSGENIAADSYGNIDWVIDADGKLTVSGTGDFAEVFNGDYDRTRAPWYPYREQITSAEVAVTGMTDASYMFERCKNMKYVDLSQFDTSQVTTMCGMFDTCYSLKNLDLSQFVTSQVTDMSELFSGCMALKSLDLSSFDTGNVKRMADMFEDCYQLQDLDIHSFNTGNVTDMQKMFMGCWGLTSLDLSHFNTANVNNMYALFYGCRNMTSVDLSSFDTTKGPTMESMFRDCSKLTSVDLSSFNLNYVTNMKSMFQDCEQLSCIDFSQFDIYPGPVVSSAGMQMQDIFKGCTSLRTIKTSRTLGREGHEASAVLPFPFYDEKGIRQTELNADNTGKTLTSVPRTEAYMIHFDSNGGTGVMLDQYFRSGEEQTLSANAFRKAGYTFEGWNTQADGYGWYHYSDGESVTDIGSKGGTVTLYAQWGPGRYSIMFDGNGSTGGWMDTLSDCRYGNSYTLPGNTYTMTDCTFAGWNTKANGKGDDYDDKDTIKLDGGTDGKVIILYAQWLEKGYRITYVLNGGTNDPANPKVYDEDTETIILAPPTRTGYTFGGWYKEEDFLTPLDQIPKGSSGALKLYAKWNANQYTVTFDGNGSQSGSMADMEDCGYDKDYLLEGNVYQKTGYTFTGWNTDKDGKGTPYADKATVKNLTAKNNGTVTLYAQWEITRYAINYHLNEGTNAESNPDCYDEFTSVTLADPMKIGYTFDGWYSDAAFLTEKVTVIPEGSEGEKDFYAKWTPNTYTVKFDGNGEAEGSMADLTERVYDQAFDLPESVFKKPPYLFAGWNTQADGKGTSYADKANVKNLTAVKDGTATLYAQWTITKYAITYNLDGGTNAAGNPAQYDEAMETITLAAPTKTGYTFDGWYSDAAFSTKVTEITKGSTGDKVLYAKWVKDETEPTATPVPSESPKPGDGSENGGSGTAGTYRIAYSLGGGTNAASNPASYNGTAAVKLADPTRTGYTFGGWYSDSTLKKGVTEIAAGSTGNLTLYAKWTANKYTISFDSNGGSGSMKAMTNRAYGTAYELSANKFKKDGSVFIGWGSSAGGTEVAYRDCDRVKDLTAEQGGSVTLYARWLDLAANNAYSITYRLNGGANDPANPSYYTEGSAVALKTPTKPGYSFEGWYAKSNLKGGKTESIDANSKGNKTLYAKWTSLTYTIKFNGNPTGITQGNSKATSGAGGKVENSMADITNAKTGKKVTLKANKFKYNGYTFAGWNTKPDGSGVAVKNKAGVKDLCLGEDGAFKDTVTLYAQWTETKYAITYKLNKGKLPTADDTAAPGAPSCPKSYTIGSDTITLAAPTRSGYTFDGWYTTKKCKDGTKVESIPSGSTGKLTLYAKWVKNK